MPNSRILVATACVLWAFVPAAVESQTPVVAVQAEERQTSAAAEADATAEPDAEPDAEIDLAALLWIARPLVVFADSANDPRYAQQMAMLAEGMGDLEDRRVIVLSDTDPAANGPLRRSLHPRGFGIVLIDTDGAVVQRRPAPTSVRELTGTIDRLPSRRQETGSRRQ